MIKHLNTFFIHYKMQSGTKAFSAHIKKKGMPQKIQQLNNKKSHSN